MKQIDAIFHRVFGDMVYTAKEQEEAITSLGRMPSMDEAARSGNMVLVLGVEGRNFIETESGVWNSTYYKHPDFNVGMALSEDRTTASILGSKVVTSKAYTCDVDNVRSGILLLDQLNQRDPRLLLEEDRGVETIFRPDVSLVGDIIYLDNIWARSISIGVGVFLPTYCIASTVSSLKEELVKVIADQHNVDHILAGLTLSEQGILLRELDSSERIVKEKLLKKAAFIAHIKELGQLSIVLAANIMMLGKMSPLITRVLSSISVALYPLSIILVPYLVNKFNKKRTFSEEDVLEIRRKLTETVNYPRYKKKSMEWLQRATLLGMFLKISTIAKVSSKPIIISAQAMAWIAQLGHAIFSLLASYQDVNAMICDVRLSVAVILSRKIKKKDFATFINEQHKSLLDVNGLKIEELLLNPNLIREFKLYMIAKKIFKRNKGKGNVRNKINEEIIADISDVIKNKVWADGFANTLKIFLSTISLGLIFPASGHIAFCFGISTLIVGLDVSRSISRIQSSRFKFKMTQVLEGSEEGDKDSFKKSNLLSVISGFIRSNLILVLLAVMISITDFFPSLPLPFLIFTPMLAFVLLGGVYTRFSEHFSPAATTIEEEEGIYFREISSSVFKMVEDLSSTSKKKLSIESVDDIESVRPSPSRKSFSPNHGGPITYMRTVVDDYEREVVGDTDRKSETQGGDSFELHATEVARPKLV